MNRVPLPDRPVLRWVNGVRCIVKHDGSVMPIIQGGSTRTISVRLQAIHSQYVAAMTTAGAATSAFANKLMSVHRYAFAFSTIGYAMAGAGAAIGFGLIQAVKGATLFESTLIKMVNLANVAESELQGISSSIAELSKLGAAPQDLAESMYFIRSSGIAAADSMDILEQSAKGAAIGLGTEIEVAQLLTSVINAYGAENITAARALDIMVAAVEEGKAEAGEMVPAFGRLLGMAAALGVEVSNLAGTFAVLTRVGTPVNEVATMISGIMSAMLSVSPRVRTALSTVGLEMEDLRRRLAEGGLVSVMEMLNRKFHGNIEALRVIFPNIRAFRGAMNLLAQDTDDVHGALDRVINSVGKSADAFERWSETNEASGKRVAAAFQLLGIVIGAVLLPPLELLGNALATVIGWISELPGPVRVVIGVLAATGAAILLTAGALLVFLPRIGMVRGELVKAGFSAGIFRGSMQMLAGAINPVTLGITALIAVLGAVGAASAARKAQVAGATEAIKADTAITADNTGAINENTIAIGENSLAWAAKEAAESGIIDRWQELGASAETVTQAITGNGEAMSELANIWGELDHPPTGPLDELGLGAIDLMERTSALAAIFVEGRGNAQDMAEGIGEAGNSAEETIDPFGVLAGAADELGISMEEAASAGEELTGILDILFGTSLNSEEALIGFRQSILSLKDELKDGARTLKGFTENALNNRSAVLSSIQAAKEYGVKISDQTGNIDKGVKAFERNLEVIKETMIASGLSRKAVEAYIRMLNLTPKNIRTIIEADTAGAQNEVDNFIRINTGRNITIRVLTSQARDDVLHPPSNPPPGDKGGHAGGRLGGSLSRRYGALRSDEIWVVGKKNEHLLTDQQYRDLMERARMSTARAALGRPPPINEAGIGDAVAGALARGGLLTLALHLDGKTIERQLVLHRRENKLLLKG